MRKTKLVDIWLKYQIERLKIHSSRNESHSLGWSGQSVDNKILHILSLPNTVP